MQKYICTSIPVLTNSRSPDLYTYLCWLLSTSSRSPDLQKYICTSIPVLTNSRSPDLYTYLCWLLSTSSRSPDLQKYICTSIPVLTAEMLMSFPSCPSVQEVPVQEWKLLSHPWTLSSAALQKKSFISKTIMIPGNGWHYKQILVLSETLEYDGR